MRAERAMVFDGTNFEEIKKWCDRYGWMRLVEKNGKKQIAVEQRHGTRCADIGDYIVEVFYGECPVPLACRKEQLKDYYPNIKVVNAKPEEEHGKV